MIRRLARPMALVALLAAPPTAALAQNLASQTSQTTGTIFQPIAVSKAADLAFGIVVKPTTGSTTVTIAAADGGRSITGAGSLLTGASAGRAEFSVSGEGGQAFAADIPGTVSMTRQGGSETLQVNLTPTIRSGTLTNALGATGAASIGVGGDVTLTSGTVTGAYTGSFQVVVTYN